MIPPFPSWTLLSPTALAHRLLSKLNLGISKVVVYEIGPQLPSATRILTLYLVLELRFSMIPNPLEFAIFLKIY